MAASPVFLVLILLGTALAFSVVIIMTFPRSDFNCVSPYWFIHSAFFLTFGSLFAKTWRVWRLFQVEKRIKVGKNDVKLLMVFVLGARDQR